ncbi:MAG: dephospho-CoA kinase, partial [Tannerella sp.]|nr:dephospho-CoA kinase [Tannerella sp.]
MIRIGITGGIGSGKSVVSRLLEFHGIPVYNADDAGRRLSNTSPVIIKGLKKLFGKEIYVDGCLDRRRLASFAFSNESVLNKVNAVIHPIVMDDCKRWADTLDADICACESAIIYEGRLDIFFDVITTVYAPASVRINRVMARDGSTEAEIIKRMNRQLPDELKRGKADFVIVNDGIRPLIPQVEEFLRNKIF